jgi:hypothetical protein
MAIKVLQKKIRAWSQNILELLWWNFATKKIYGMEALWVLLMIKFHILKFTPI